MSHLAKLVCPECVIPQLQASETEPVVEEMIDHLVSLGRVALEDRNSFVEAVMEREHQIGTGVGSGVAIPHARIEGLLEAVAVIGRSDEGIDFQSPDNSPARCVCLLLVPESQVGIHLQMLAELARVFRHCETRERVMQAGTAEELCQLLTSGAA